MLRTIDPIRSLGLLADLAVHVHDLAEAVPGVAPPSAEATQLGCARYAPLLQERLAEEADVALTVLIGGDVWEAEAGTHQVRLEADAADFLCAVTGRRTRKQAEALGWIGADAELQGSILNNFTQYGPFRST